MASLLAGAVRASATELEAGEAIGAAAPGDPPPVRINLVLGKIYKTPAMTRLGEGRDPFEAAGMPAFAERRRLEIELDNGAAFGVRAGSRGVGVGFTLRNH